MPPTLAIAPYQLGQRSIADLRSKIGGTTGVVDNGLDLRPVPNDASVAQQALDVGLVEACDRLDLEPSERAPEVLTLREDRPPAETGLETLEAEPLENRVIAMHRAAPLIVVVGEVEVGRAGDPPAARLAVVGDEQFGHGESASPDR